MTNSEAPPSKGLVAGKYELVRLIGRGGMGSVWEAKHVSLGTSSAIKFIESEYANSSEARSRFDKEAKAAATIQSKHAIQIFDYGVTDDGKPYIVMELLQGEPLDKLIDRGPIGLVETARILQQVCRGLARAHERGIIHRDLKPENIFLVRTPDEEEAIAKVLDFGIAKMQNNGGPTSGLTSSTKTGAVLGTPFYMSPEQARGLRNVDHRADVWSLGVIAFKCVTGTLPFDGESVGDLLVKICTSPVPIPSQVAASLGIGGIPPSFDSWFLRALDREPERRFPNVTQLAEELCATAGIHPRGGVPSSYTPNTPRELTGHPMGLTPAGAPYGSGRSATPNNLAFGAPQVTPAPGAMTNAPFTREEVSAVPTGKGKLALGAILAGLLTLASVSAVFVMMRKNAVQRVDPANGAGVVSGAVSGLPAAITSTDTPVDPTPSAIPATPASSPVAKNIETNNVTPPPLKSGRSGFKHPAPTAPVKTSATPTPPTLPPPTPPPKETQTPPAPPSPSPPPKKTNKNDPGY